MVAFLVVGLGWAAPATAESPITCLAEVDGAQFDQEPDFAGRVRSFAGDDGTIETRSLRCPYRTADGRVTELVVEWDLVPMGRFTCARDTLMLDGADPATGRLDHPERQGAVLLEGPDEAALRAMEAGARVMVGAVPESAAPCTAVVAAPEPASGRSLLPLVLAGIGVLGVVVAAVVLGRRRRRRRPAEPVAAVPSDRRSPVPLARHLCHQARTRPLDDLAAASVIAVSRGRLDLARVAVAARRRIPAVTGDHRSGPGSRLAGKILEAAGPPADGSDVTTVEPRRPGTATPRRLDQQRDSREMTT